MAGLGLLKKIVKKNNDEGTEAVAQSPSPPMYSTEEVEEDVVMSTAPEPAADTVQEESTEPSKERNEEEQQDQPEESQSGDDSVMNIFEQEEAADIEFQALLQGMEDVSIEELHRLAVEISQELKRGTAVTASIAGSKRN